MLWESRLGDLIVPPIYIEVKHPNSKKQLSKLVRKFNKKLKAKDLYGVFVVGIEDMFSLGDNGGFETSLDFNLWLKSKRYEIEKFGIDFLREVSYLTRILAVAQTQTMVEAVGPNSRLCRLGNSCVFDNRYSVSKDEWKRALQVAEAFNPHPRLWTQLGLALESISDEPNGK